MTIDMSRTFITDMRMSGEPDYILVEVVEFVQEPEFHTGQAVRALVDSF
jgi:hypothetical protein